MWPPNLLCRKDLRPWQALKSQSFFSIWLQLSTKETYPPQKWDRNSMNTLFANASTFYNLQASVFSQKFRNTNIKSWQLFVYIQQIIVKKCEKNAKVFRRKSFWQDPKWWHWGETIPFKINHRVHNIRTYVMNEFLTACSSCSPR